MTKPDQSIRTASQDIDQLPHFGGDASQIFEKLVAFTALFLLGLRQFIEVGFTTGYIVALFLIPVWIGHLRHYWGARFMFVVGVLALASGALLAAMSRTDHQVGIGAGLNDAALIIGLLCGIGVILWARRVLTISQVGMAFGAGMLAAAMLGDGRFSANAWKFAWAIPLAIFVLSAANRPGKRFLELLLVLGLAGVSAIADSRSYFATFLLTAILVAWQMRPVSQSRASSRTWTALLMVGVTVAIYNLGTTLLVDGVLGEEAQARSIAQIDTAGSLILGGRPELAATIGLMGFRPMGFGVGVIPNLHDITAAKRAMLTINYDPNNGYVDNFMFGGKIELHSITGGLWAKFGLVGLVLTAAIAVILVRGLIDGIISRTGSAVSLFLICFSMWNLAFSPLYGSLPTLTLALGLAFRASAAEPDDGDGTDSFGALHPEFPSTSRRWQ